MRQIRILILSVIFFPAFLSCSAQEAAENQDPDRVLVFSKTEGFRHNSIADGKALFQSFDAKNENLQVAITENAGEISSPTLQNLDAVVFLNTTGDVLNETQEAALRQFIQNGGGFMGIHAATDTEYGWPWYGRLIGARFTGHPEIQEANLTVLRSDHPSTSHLSNPWVRTDEWYNFSDIQDHIIPLINLEEDSYEGGENGANHPIAWYHEFEGGRIFYTGGGHTSESYSDTLFVQHVWGGLQYVLNRGD